MARILEQPEPGNLLPYRFSRPPCWFAFTLLVSVAFLTAGALLLSQCEVAEVIIPYLPGDTAKNFTLDADIAADVHISYELPGLLLNTRMFLENQDPRIITSASQPRCDDSSTWDAVLWRRRDDPVFAQLLPSPSPQLPGPLKGFAPCGLVAMTMFLDSFSVYRLTNGSWTRLAPDESNVFLGFDAINFEKLLSKAPPGSPYDYLVDGEVSWLRQGSLMAHFKVWQRTPASPGVRNLWAVISGGLPRGTYQVVFDLNSPVWTQHWGVPEKRVIISESHVLGSPGATKFVGAVCLAIGTLEAFILLLFGVLFLYVEQNRKIAENAVKPYSLETE